MNVFFRPKTWCFRTKQWARTGGLAVFLLFLSQANAELLLRYGFDESESGIIPALDAGLSPAASGSFTGSATRTNSTPGGYSAAALNASGANGTSHYLSAGDADKLDALSNLTITAWINLRAAPAASDRIVSKLANDGGRATGFDLRVMDPQTGTLGAGNFRLGLAVINGQSVSGLPTVTSPAAFSASNAWTFIAVSYDGAKVRFYAGATNTATTQAGADANKHASFGTPTNTTADFRIGGTAAATADRTPPGWFDDVRIYDNALPIAELEIIRQENSPLAPVVQIQPQNRVAEAGANASFTVTVIGTPPLNYQWYFVTNSVTNTLSDATNAILNLTNLTFAQAGVYYVEVSNVFGATTSTQVNLTILPPAPPSLLSAVSSPTRRAVLLTFDRPLADSATNLAGFELSGGLIPLGATLETGTFTNLVLTTTPQTPNTAYSLTVTGIQGRLGGSGAMVPVTTNFISSALYGPLNNVPEAAGWTLLCSLNLPDFAAYHSNNLAYDIDHRQWITNFSRVAYYLELHAGKGQLQYVWAAMDAFATDPLKLGVPTRTSGMQFQQPLNNLDVRSSVPGIVTGTGLVGGSIQFVPGDEVAPASAGRGLMQIKHNGNLLFAFNGWGLGAIPDLGIGNNTGNSNADWSYMTNATSWLVKRMIIYVLPRTNAPVDADVVVYGGTSGGVIAAVQAARMGKRTVLLCTDNHLGGMSSGGLGWTDVGQNGTDYIGGLAREYYRRNGARYGKSIQFNLEPKVAEQLFAEMLAEAGVRVVFNQRLASVTMNNLRITQIVAENGSVYRGRMFIDTTYEGDLIAKAGVSFTVGRESTNTYGESYAGVVTPGNGGYDFSPYVAPGDTNSGLVPLVMSVTPGARGSADNGVQAYNFRLCFAQAATNFLPITAPINYRESQFELLARYLEARVAKDGSTSLGAHMTLARPPVPGKYDINNNGHISTDFVGESWTWPTNTHANRDIIQKAHEDYTRSLFIYFATHPRVPANVRGEMQSWGLCRDEFLDTGGWPHTLYVREARRMVSDYVMLQHNCQGIRVAPESIGLGSYPMDSHLIHRYANGNLTFHEGGMFNTSPDPFPISYRSIIPRAGECENVFCTFALSASHVAFGSCRMEPVFMLTSQSAATAAAFAIDDHVPVQQVNYAKLSAQLLADGQVLDNGNGNESGIIVDNKNAGAITNGEWSSSTATLGYWGADYLLDGNTNKGTKSVTFIPVLPTNDVYEVYLRWTAHANRATNVPVEIVHPAGTNAFIVNQQINGGAWVLLLRTNFNVGTNAQVILRTDNTSGYVVADAVRFLSTNLPPSQVRLVATVPMTAEGGLAPARIAFIRSGDTNQPLTLNYTLSGTASNGVDYAALPGALVLAAGVTITNLNLSALPDALFEGDETVTLTLLPGTNYTTGFPASADLLITESAQTLRIANRPNSQVLTGFQTGFSGEPFQTYTIQAATNLNGPWGFFTSLTAGTNGLFTLEDPLLPGSPSRLFRLLAP